MSTAIEWVEAEDARPEVLTVTDDWIGAEQLAEGNDLADKSDVALVFGGEGMGMAAITGTLAELATLAEQITAAIKAASPPPDVIVTDPREPTIEERLAWQRATADYDGPPVTPPWEQQPITLTCPVCGAVDCIALVETELHWLNLDNVKRAADGTLTVKVYPDKYSEGEDGGYVCTACSSPVNIAEGIEVDYR